MHAAVGGVQQGSVQAGNPAFGSIDKSYVQQIGVNAGSLLKPGAAAVGGRKNSTSCTDRPAQTIPDKAGRDKSRTRPVADYTVVPRRRRDNRKLRAFAWPRVPVPDDLDREFPTRARR